jgi:ATP phosphoribosyltransferase
VHELIERFDGHLKAEQYYSVIANMRGESPEQVATLLIESGGLVGLQGPTISSVYNMEGDGSAAQHGFYAATICVPKKKLYTAVKTLQKVRFCLFILDLFTLSTTIWFPSVCSLGAAVC